jgi:hypothetical protein
MKFCCRWNKNTICADKGSWGQKGLPHLPEPLRVDITVVLLVVVLGTGVDEKWE